MIPHTLPRGGRASEDRAPGVDPGATPAPRATFPVSTRRTASSHALPVGLFLLSLALAGPCVRSAGAAEGNGRSPLEDSVVTLEITSKAYDYFQPWTKPTRAVRKHAIVLKDRELVTTAQSLADRTLVRAQKGGRGRWFNAEVKWADYHANVALVTVDADDFWKGLNPADIAPSVPRQNDYEIIRWRDGNLETRRADFSKFTVGEGSMSFSPRLHLELNTEIGGLGWAEPVVAAGKVIGLTVSKSGNVCNVMPMPFVSRILDAVRADKFPGLGYFDFVWQQGENPATLEYLHLPGDPRGAIIIEIPKTAGPEYKLRRFDVLLEVDGFAVDMEGDYEDPDYGHLMMEGLATRRHFAGEQVPMKVLRDGKVVDVDYVLPKARYSVDLLPMYDFDREPEYVIAGGLIFQPLDQSYLRGWGDDWRRRAPFRLVYFNSQPPTSERSALVILSQVLPDPYNVGYQEIRNLVVDSVNGHKINHVADLEAALKDPKDGFHRIDFLRGDAIQRVLLDAAQLDTATARVLDRYGIPAPSVIETQPASGS